MKKKNIFSVLLTLIMLFHSTACQFPEGLISGIVIPSMSVSENNSTETNEHIHTFSGSWNNDETHHWHDATCGHDERSNYERHDFSAWRVILEPDGNVPGLREKTCNTCSYRVEAQYGGTDEHVHSPFDNYEIYYPTCEQDGYEKYTCACSKEVYIKLPATGHELYIEESYDNEHHTFTTRCKNCSFNETIISAHNYEERIILEPTATTEGLRESYCKECGYKETFSIPKLEHKHEYNTVFIYEPTCEREGYSEAVCECGESYVFDYVAMIDHDYSVKFNWDFNSEIIADAYLECNANPDHKDFDLITIEGFEIVELIHPTETSEGFIKVKAVAEYLGNTYVEYNESMIPMLEHSHDYNMYEELKPTCNESGYERYYCSCGDYVETIIEPSHSITIAFEWMGTDYCEAKVICENCDYSETYATTIELNDYLAPTETTDGYVEYKAYFIYKEEYVESFFNYVEPALGHSYQAEFTWESYSNVKVIISCVNGCETKVDCSEDVLINLLEYVSPTCEEEGYAHYEAYVGYDGEMFASSYSETYAKTGHRVTSGYCESCQQVIPSEGLVYESNPNTLESVLVSLGSCKDSTIYIADTYNGYPVTTIATNAIHRDYYDTSFINNIILPDSIKTVEDNAISAINLSYLYVPDSVTYFSDNSVNCYNYVDSKEYKTLVLFESSEQLDSIANLFMDCNGRLGVEKVFYIEENLYTVSSSLATLVSYGTQTDYVTLPPYIYYQGEGYSLTSIAPYAFRNCNATSIDLVGSNIDTLERYCFWNSNLKHFGISDKVIYANNIIGCINDALIAIEYESIPSTWDSMWYDNTMWGITTICMNTRLSDIVSLDDGTIYKKNEDSMALYKYNFTGNVDLTKPLTLSNGEVLTNYEIGENLFSYNSNITSIKLNDTIERITTNMFSGCSSLSNIYISNTVKIIDDYAFANLSDVSVTFEKDSTLEYIGVMAFDSLSGSFTFEDGLFPNTLKEIGEKAFNNSSIVSLVFEENSVLTKVGAQAFRNCHLLSSVSFGENSQLEEISNSMFERCSSLREINLPNTIKSIGDNAFYYSGLTEFTVPEGIEHFGSSFLGNCNSLTKIIIPNLVDLSKINGYEFGYGNNKMIIINQDRNPEVEKRFVDNGYIVFFADVEPVTYQDEYYSYYLYDEKAILFKCNNVASEVLDIPSSVTYGNVNYEVIEIATRAFEGNDNIISVKIPSSVKVINTRAFYDCNNLSMVTFEEGLQELQDFAFSNTMISMVSFPESLTYIGNDVFSNVDTYTLPSNIEYVGYSWKKMTYIIPENLTNDLSNSNFLYNPYNNTFEVLGDNIRYEVIGQTLVDNITKTILNSKDLYEFPEGYTTIGKTAYMTNIWEPCSIVVPNGVIKILDGAFENACIEYFYIPSSVESIADSVFNMGSLAENYKIEYGGTIQEFVSKFSEKPIWLLISYNSSTISVHCTDGVYEFDCAY